MPTAHTPAIACLPVRAKRAESLVVCPASLQPHMPHSPLPSAERRHTPKRSRLDTLWELLPGRLEGAQGAEAGAESSSSLVTVGRVGYKQAYRKGAQGEEQKTMSVCDEEQRKMRSW